MKKIKYQRYKEIFNTLLPDAKGLISQETVYKSSLPNPMRKIISPLLEELQELNETLDFNEFYEAMEMLMKVITPGDKSALLLPLKPKPVPKQEYDFKPKTNNFGHVSTSSFGVYERNVQKKREISKKIEKIREIKAEAEMKECKFSPAIMNRKTQNRSGNIFSISQA